MAKNPTEMTVPLAVHGIHGIRHKSFYFFEQGMI